MHGTPYDCTASVPLALVGGPLMQRDRVLFDLVEECGGRIVLDATETGQRGVRGPFDRRRLLEDPLMELAEAYFRIPDASRRPNSELYQWLKDQLARAGRTRHPLSSLRVVRQMAGGVRATEGMGQAARAPARQRGRRPRSMWPGPATAIRAFHGDASVSETPRQITLQEWDDRYERLLARGVPQPVYGGPLGRHVADGDTRLLKLRFDNSPAALRLWNFLLTEEDRLRAARDAGKKLVGTMKDLGTVPVMAYSLDNLVAFYPDGAWWIPCVMEVNSGLLQIADSLGIDESFCPVRAMLGAFVTEAHFPIPDLLTCSVGATCDDFSAIAQRLNGLGHPILWWEIPHRRAPEDGEEAVQLPGGFSAPREPDRIRASRNWSASEPPWRTWPGSLSMTRRSPQGIAKANQVRRLLARASAPGVHGHALSDAGSGDAHRGDAGDSLLLGPG